jgi:ABC-type transport system involved in multi-copper enzyme maturation permease subunit
MTRALLLKELRECWPLAALGVVAAIYALLQHTGWTLFSRHIDFEQLSYDRALPFVNDNFVKTLSLVGGGLAIALGLKQSAWEDARGSYRFLLYRPVSRRRVFALKLLLGICLVLSITAGLILAFTVWSTTPGNHGSPFYLSMTIDAWRTWLVLPVVYLSAFLCGLRPAQWFGTRLAPLAAGIFLAMILAAQPLWEVTLVGTVIAIALLTLCLLHLCETRDY